MADFGAKDAPTINEVRRRSEEYEMYIEASIMPPKSADDVARFESDVRLAQAAGASLARTVVFPGRRYEQFKTLADFKDHEKRALQLLQWAVPVLEKQKFQLAVENHKDQRVPEKLELLKTLGSEYVGICVDVGNSFTLLEDPLETVRAYAPYAMAVHLKDQAVRENETGFLFADVPLGEGFLPLQEMVRVLKQAKPAIHLGLELITRDALDVPVLRPDYWVTMPDVPATELAQALKVVRAHSSRNPFAVVSSLPAMKQMALETHNLKQSMTFWRAALAGK